MAGCLIDAGHQLTVYDVRSEATAALCARGARAEDSPRGVAQQSAVVFTSLPGPREVEFAVLDPSAGILAGLLVFGFGRFFGEPQVDRASHPGHGQAKHEQDQSYPPAHETDNTRSERAAPNLQSNGPPAVPGAR